MAKKVAKICKLQFQAGGARPGPALASAGINMPQFCTQFNDATKDRLERDILGDVGFEIAKAEADAVGTPVSR